MRIAILGAGAMGSWFGGRLAMHGADVQLLTTNKAHCNAVRNNGLTMCTAAGAQSVSLPIYPPEQLQNPIDIIMLFIKAFQSDLALAAVTHVVDDHPHVLTLQNGLGNSATIANYLPLDRVWMGVTMMPVEMVEPGIVVARGNGISIFGGAVGQDHSMAKQILDLFAPTDLNIKLDPNIHRHIWEKVAYDAGMNAFCALARGTPGVVGIAPGARDLVKDVAVEVAAVAYSQDVEIDLDQVLATIDHACAEHGDHRPSMLQDLQSMRRTEVDALNGAVVALAEKAGVPAPLNHMLATLIRLAELAHKPVD
jgi:2-dehydropantoate 2-reductase